MVTAGSRGRRKEFWDERRLPCGRYGRHCSRLIEGRSTVYYSMGHDDSFDRQVFGWINQIRAKVRTGAKPPGDISDLAVLLHEHRLIKSEAEVRIMQRAADISAEAHCRAMRECRQVVMNTIWNLLFSMVLRSTVRAFLPITPLSVVERTPVVFTTRKTMQDAGWRPRPYRRWL